MEKLDKEVILKKIFQEIKPLEITLVVYIIRIKLKLVGGKKDIQITLPKWLIAQTGTALELK